MNERHSLVLSKVPRYHMIVIVLKYLEPKVVSLGDVDSAVKPEETIVSVCPSRVARISKMFLS